MATTPQNSNPEDAHADLLATIAASRELGPEMDASLAQRYLERHPETANNGQSLATRTDSPMDVNRFMAGFMLPALGIVAYIVILVLSQGHLWWLFWLPMAMGGWWWGGEHHGDRRAAREEMRQARYEARTAYYRDRARRYGDRRDRDRYQEHYD